MKYAWHKWLGMKKHSKAWHLEDLADELQEYREARGPILRWSELSDVVFAYIRGRLHGYKLVFPLSRWKYLYGHIYMYPKYTLRFLFFRRAGRKLGARIHEVRNPRKPHKLRAIAEQYKIDPDQFIAICERQLRYWPLLP